MSQYYRFEISSPATRNKAAKSIVWTSADQIVQQAEIDVHRGDKNISTVTVIVWDQEKNRQKWPIANDIPDPAFASILFKVFLSKNGEGAAAAKLVFDGVIGSLQLSYPAVSNLTVVAHDRSLLMRAQARYRTFKNKTSVQLAKALSQDYGLEVDTSELVAIAQTQRVIDAGLGAIGGGALSDWNHLVRALSVDGLELYMSGKKVKIRKKAQAVYPHTFKPDDGLVLTFRPQINHVGSPGAGGQMKVAQPGGNKGTVAAATGTNATETNAAGNDATTDRTPPQGPTDDGKPHTESTGSYKEQLDHRFKRKDEAELVTRSLPDLGLQHLVSVSGWGGKFDGNWHVQSVKHVITGSSPATSSISLTRELSDASSKQIGIQPGGTR